MANNVQPISGSGALVAARFCNFPTGKSAPLPEHVTWMNANVKPIVADNKTAWVDLLGFASRQWKNTNGLNSHSLNMQLSFERCEAVKKVVAGFNSAANFNIEMGEGDKTSLMPSPDDGYDRAVEIYVYGSNVHPPRPKPQPLPESKDFEIRVVGGGSGSIIAQTDDYFFQIVDLLRRQTMFFFYTGLGIGISIPKIPGPGSVTKAGPPTRFNTTSDTHLYMFNSKAQLYQDPGATLGPYSVGGTMRLSIDEIFDGKTFIFTRPGLIPISGGSGIQMPGLGSASQGVLAKVTEALPFTGY